MSPSASRAESECAVVATIIDGRPWTATPLRNPHFRKYCHQLNRTFRHSRAVANALRPQCRRLAIAVAERSHLLTTTHPLTHDLVPALLRVAAYSRRWIRQPEDWQPPARLLPEEQWRDLLRHLFAKWPVPEFFDRAWQVRGSLVCLDRDWFCHVAGGGSWRRAEGMPDEISRHAIHFALGAPSHLNPRQALRWGQLGTLGASAGLAGEVLGHPMVNDFSHEDIWSRLLAKLAATSTFEPREFGIIAEIIADLLQYGHVKRASLLVSQPLSDLREHCYGCWRDLLASAENEGMKFRHRDLTRPGLRNELMHLARTHWEPMGDMEPFVFRRRGRAGLMACWTIRERCSHAQLTAEGREMKHCVAGYWRRCLLGYSAIFTLRRQNPGDAPAELTPCVTIEVDKGTRRIIQARGKWNRIPDAFEHRLIEIWANRNKLKMAG
jgi:hypothetical protein